MKSLIIILLSVLVVSSGMAQQKLEKSVLASGATKANNIELKLHGTIGQRFVGKASGEELNVNIGFWESVIARMSTSIIEVDPSFISEAFVLGQNYPNPADHETRIEIRIPYRTDVRLVLVGMDGRRLGVLHTGSLHAGKYVFTTDVSHLPQGQYKYALLINNNMVDSKPLLVLHGQ